MLFMKLQLSILYSQLQKKRECYWDDDIDVEILPDFQLQIYRRYSSITSVTHPEFFLGRPVHPLNPHRCHYGWRLVDEKSKFVSPDTLKMHSLTLSALRFLCDFLDFFLYFPNYLSFHYEKFLFIDDIKKFIY